MIELGCDPADVGLFGTSQCRASENGLPYHEFAVGDIRRAQKLEAGGSLLGVAFAADLTSPGLLLARFIGEREEALNW
jgi:hypothetical protein